MGQASTIIDPNKKKKQTILPPVQIGQDAPLIPRDAQAGQQQVIQAAQQRVLGAQPSTLQPLVQQRTTELLQQAQPQTAQARQQDVNRQLDQFRREQAQALEAQRQATGGISGLGERDRQLASLALQQTQQGQDLKRQLGREAAEQTQQDLLAAIAAGREGIGQEADLRSKAIQDLTSVVGAGEGEAQREFTKEVMKTEQEYEAIQRDLDRKLQEAIQKNDIAAQREILQQKQTFEQEQNDLDREQQRFLLDMQNVHDDEMQLSEQEFERGNMFIQSQLEQALRNNELTRAKELANYQTQLELKQMIQGADLTQQQLILQNELENATANNDVERQKQILGFQTEQDFLRMEKQFGQEEAMFQLDRAFETAFRNEDYLRSVMLNEQKYQVERERMMLDKQLADASRQLQERGMDIAEIEAEYNFVKSEIEAGRASPEDAVAYLNRQLSDPGTGEPLITMPDENAIATQLNEEYNNMKIQYALTHPEFAITDSNGQVTGLQDEAINDFNAWQNSVLFDETTDTAKIRSGEISLEGVGVADPLYQQALNDPLIPSITFSRGEDRKGANRNTFTEFEGLTAGDKVEFAGEIWEFVNKDIDRKVFDKNTTMYQLKNARTGDLVVFDTSDATTVAPFRG